MPPKKRKPTEDIRSYFNKKTVSPGGSSSTESSQPGEASTSQMKASRLVRVKKEEEEEEDDLEGRHSHQFKVKFPNESKEYTIDCDQPRTVLDVIKLDLSEQFKTMMDKRRNYSDEKIIIQRSNESIIATHFPCSCIENDESLKIFCKTEEVQETKSQHDRILPRDKYSVFDISKEGGENARKRKLFKSKTVKEFKFLCVYAKKGTSVKEALERDGRFVDLGVFKLSEVENSKKHTLCTQKVDKLDQTKFDICFPRQKTAKANYANEKGSSEQQEQPSTSKQSKQKVDTKSVLVEAQKSGISVKQAMEEKGSKVNTKEIYDLLCKQFQDLKRLMESRFPGNSYQKALELKKENFGKIQQSFNEVHRVKKLLKLGESVCLLKFNGSQGTVQGTGFLLFDNFILTNAHLFKMCTDLPSDQWKDHVKITGTFNYEIPKSNKIEFTAKLCGGRDIGLDYAILELNFDNQTQAGLPEGLLSKFALPPVNGEACLIGHPGGKVKQIDPTCIITKEERDHIFTLHSIKQGIRNDPYADVYVTYNTFMYHGASGSPVFDADGGVFGLHTGGFLINAEKSKEDVVAYALSLRDTLQNFVEELKKSGNKELLERFKEARNENKYLEQIIK